MLPSWNGSGLLVLQASNKLVTTCSCYETRVSLSLDLFQHGLIGVVYLPVASCLEMELRPFTSLPETR